MVKEDRLLHLFSTVQNTNGVLKYDRFYNHFTNPKWNHFSVPRMQPVVIQVPSFFDNITEFNNTFEIYVNGNDRTQQLAPGYYSNATILVFIAGALNNAIAQEYNISPAVIGTTIIQLGDGKLFIQSPFTGVPSPNTCVVEIKNTKKNNLAPALGVLDTIKIIQNVATICPITPNLFGPAEVLVHCDVLADEYSMHEDEKNTAVIAHIPLAQVPYGSLATFKFSEFHAHSIPIHNQPTNRWNIRLTDGFYNPIFLPKNQSVHLQLKMYNNE